MIANTLDRQVKKQTKISMEQSDCSCTLVETVKLETEKQTNRQTDIVV